MGDKKLPPMPKLRPRPGFTLVSDDFPTPPLKKRKIIANVATEVPDEHQKKCQQPPPLGTIEIIEEDAKTSRLLTKSECGRGGGRKRNSGSSIHSIPKFSQVVCPFFSEKGTGTSIRYLVSGSLCYYLLYYKASIYNFCFIEGCSKRRENKRSTESFTIKIAFQATF